MSDEAAIRLRKRADEILTRHPDLLRVKDFHDMWWTWTPRAEAAYLELEQIRYELAHLNDRTPA